MKGKIPKRSPQPLRGRGKAEDKLSRRVQGKYRFFVMYREGRTKRGSQWVASHGIPYEVLALNQKEAQSLFAKYIGRTPPLGNVLDFSDMIGVWAWIAEMKPRVVRDFYKVSQEKAWKR